MTNILVEGIHLRCRLGIADRLRNRSGHSLSLCINHPLATADLGIKCLIEVILRSNSIGPHRADAVITVCHHVRSMVHHSAGRNSIRRVDLLVEVILSAKAPGQRRKGVC